jgi:hypothetical protein
MVERGHNKEKKNFTLIKKILGVEGGHMPTIDPPDPPLVT